MARSIEFPVDTRRRFNVYKTSYRRLIDAETTSCVYWVCMCKIAEWFDCAIAPERSDSTCFKFSKTPVNRIKP